MEISTTRATHLFEVKMSIMRRLLLALVFSSSIVCSDQCAAVDPFVQFTLRDSAPPDGVADNLRLSSDVGYIGQVTGPYNGVHHPEEETFLEFSLPSSNVPSQAILHLNLFYSDDALGKTVSLSTYAGNGIPSLSLYGTGNFFDTFLLPLAPGSGQQYALDIDVTSVVETLIGSNADYLGIRLHDPVFINGPGPAQVALGGSGHGILPQTLEFVPEPRLVTHLLCIAALTPLFGTSRQRFGPRAPSLY